MLERTWFRARIVLVSTRWWRRTEHYWILGGPVRIGKRRVTRLHSDWSLLHRVAFTKNAPTPRD